MSKNENLQRLTITLFTALLLIIIISCAKIGSPVGGPKDITPPKVIVSKPDDSSTNFIPRKKIVITFDEYIELKNIFQELMISPPLEEDPQAAVKGKSIVVEFPDNVTFDTTTYTLSFGKSITDINEGNLLSNYEFVFSLKDYIDSMNVEGHIVNAFDHSPDKEPMLVMLYKNLTDSAPIKEKPRYASRTDESGNFSLHNLEPGTYRLFALKDANANMLFDLPDEQIAFYDSFIELVPEKFEEEEPLHNDTLAFLADSITTPKTDTSVAQIQKPEEDPFLIETSDAIVFAGELGMARPGDTESTPVKSGSTKADSIGNDTLEIERLYVYTAEMGFFTEVQKNQYRTNEARLQPELLFFSFNQTLADTLDIFPLNYKPLDDWYLTDFNKNFDTLRYWITDTAMIAQDSLQFELRYPVFDTLGNLVSKTDTVFMNLTPKEEKKAGTGRKKGLFGGDQKVESVDTMKVVKRLPLANNIKDAGALDLNKQIEIISKTPIQKIVPERIQLFRMEDTIPIPIKFKVESDTGSMYKCLLSYSAEEQTNYKALIPDSTLFDIYGLTNDTTFLQFKTQQADFYGILTLRVSNITEPIILQVLDEKEKLVYENYLVSDQLVNYSYMYPGKYLLKIIIDPNGNRKWDTGNYLKKLQPERVIYYPQTINVRSNWEIDLSWQLNY